MLFCSVEIGEFLSRGLTFSNPLVTLIQEVLGVFYLQLSSFGNLFQDKVLTSRLWDRSIITFLPNFN